MTTKSATVAERKRTLPRTQFYAAVLASIPAFQMGVAIGSLNPLTEVLTEHLQISATDLRGWPAIVSIFCPAGFLGTQLAASVATLGRARAVNASAQLSFAGGCLSGACGLLAAKGSRAGFALLFLGRCAAGVAAGIATVVVPVYLSEISDAGNRGFFGAFFQLAVVVGIFVAQLFAVLLAHPSGFGWFLLCPAVASAVQLSLSPANLPESPAWLRLAGRGADAAKVCDKLGLDPESSFPTGAIGHLAPLLLGSGGGGDDDDEEEGE
eukprot:CAMPEP_0172588166 /NCGR_PEP_ID=MMETSP1068-20121228/7109_1 /TAXON_ID=35684 /ORGANISM="Pseudopedinella elastica, Strain CCMP716" /LENGTH=266 /DNA_ID=CAMNT_0013383411 /DNA_START=46 /DNA_END=843 /DNA_ORIENTATION=+